MFVPDYANVLVKVQGGCYFRCDKAYTQWRFYGGAWVGHGPPSFLLGPRLAPPVYFLTSRLSSFG